MKLNVKSKNFRIILFSVIGLAVLGLVVLLLSVTSPDSGEEEETVTTTSTIDPALVLQPEEKGDIVSITVENSLGSFTAKLIETDGETLWTIDGTKIPQNLLNQNYFESLAMTMTNMTARSVIEEAPADLAQYGLEKPQAIITVNYTDGSYVFKIGDVVTSGSANYVMINDEPTVYSYYTYEISSLLTYDELSMVSTGVMPAYNSEKIKKITVTRKDLEKPIILEALPEVPEDSDSIQIYSYAFTSPGDVYLDLNNGNEYLYAMYGLTAQKAAYVEVNDETRAAAGLDDPFCEVDMLVEDVIYRLYIGNAITEDVTDEETGVTTTSITGFYGLLNKVPDVIYIFSADSLVWATMKNGDYMSKLFLVPYIYDIETVSYHDSDTSFTVTITGNNDENAMYIDGEEIDADRFRSFYQYLVGCRGEEMYTDEARGDFIAEFTYHYEDERGDDTVTFYASEDDRMVIIAINDVNVFKTKWNYQTRLLENAKALISGGEIVQNY